MGLFDRMSRLMRANLNDMVSKAENSETVINLKSREMEEYLIQLRQNTASAIANQKRYQQQYNQNHALAQQYDSRAELAIEKGDENCARECLQRKESYLETANNIKQILDQHTTSVDTLKRNLITLESKISEAKTKKNLLKARAQPAKANEQLQGMIDGINPSGKTANFERMEEKVLKMEAQSQAAGELVGSDLESQFAALEAGSDVDDELEAMKAQLSGASPNQAKLPQGRQTSDAPKSYVDAELEALRNQLDKM